MYRVFVPILFVVTQRLCTVSLFPYHSWWHSVYVPTRAGIPWLFWNGNFWQFAKWRGYFLFFFNLKFVIYLSHMNHLNKMNKVLTLFFFCGLLSSMMTFRSTWRTNPPQSPTMISSDLVPIPQITCWRLIGALRMGGNSRRSNRWKHWGSTQLPKPFIMQLRCVFYSENFLPLCYIVYSKWGKKQG